MFSLVIVVKMSELLSPFKGSVLWEHRTPKIVSSCGLYLGCYEAIKYGHCRDEGYDSAFQATAEILRPITAVCDKVHNNVYCWESYWFPIWNPKWHFQNQGGSKQISQESHWDSITGNHWKRSHLWVSFVLWSINTPMLSLVSKSNLLAHLSMLVVTGQMNQKYVKAGLMTSLYTSIVYNLSIYRTQCFTSYTAVMRSISL